MVTPTKSSNAVHISDEQMNISIGISMNGWSSMVIISTPKPYMGHMGILKNPRFEYSPILSAWAHTSIAQPINDHTINKRYISYRLKPKISIFS